MTRRLSDLVSGRRPPAVRPDTFIVGAAKCGTTAMYHYLGQHPSIFMSAYKEPNYFCDDLNVRSLHARNLDTYLALFVRGEGATRVGEASVAYLLSTRAASNLAAFAPRGRVIVMLRNPVDAVYSMHGQLVFSRIQAEKDFARALARRPAPHDNDWLDYRRFMRFGEQAQRYFTAFERSRICIVRYEELRADTAATYDRVLRFLGVTPHQLSGFGVVNAHKVPRSDAVQRLLTQPPDRSRSFARAAIPDRMRHQILRWLIRRNTRRAPREPMPPSLRARLVAQIHDDIQHLQELTQLDLTKWQEP
ncbi:MAG: sulfotransferase domain-containing protein [Egibacteraceae bacterium]